MKKKEKEKKNRETKKVVENQLNMTYTKEKTFSATILVTLSNVQHTYCRAGRGKLFF